jgi:general secretion pathway protein E
MPTPAFIDYSPTALPASVRALGVSLTFNPIRLIFLIVWVYLCLYFIQCVEFSALVPKNRKSIANIVTLFAGPIPLLVLLIVDAAKKSAESGDSVLAIIAEHIQNAVANVRASGFGKPRDDSKIKLFDTAGRGLKEIYGHGKTSREDRHVLELTEQIIMDALEEEASDILIDPKDDSTYTVRFRIDGVLRTVEQIQADKGQAVINSIKAVSSMDISERRRPQDGAFTATTADSTASFRVASAGVLHGEKLSVRVLNQNASRFTLTNVGLLQKQQVIIQNAISKPSGMILLSGPTGSGKTTTLYAMLNEIDFFTRNVITVEDPIECVLPNVSQIEVNPKAEITFAKSLRSILRQDPDVICVGEIRDEETAAIALRASQTGHLVLATVHGDTNASALIRLLDLGVTPVLLSSGLSVLICQRLLRRLCNKCKRPAELSKSQIDYLHGHGTRHDNVFEAKGCEHCYGTGYRGRTGVFDILVLDDRLKARIAEGELSIAALRSDGNKKGTSNLRREGVKLVAAGVTSLAELKRVVG